MKSSIDRWSNAISLISIGTILLLLNFDYFSLRDLFSVFIKYWPILIVISGFKIIFSTIKFGNVVNLIVDILVFGAIIYMLLTGTGVRGDWSILNWVKVDSSMELVDRQDEVIRGDFTNVKKVSYEFDIKASKFEIVDSEIGNSILKMDSTYPKSFGESKINKSIKDDTLTLQFEQNSDRKSLPFTNDKVKYKFSTVADLVADYKLSIGAGEGTVELGNSLVERLKVDLGAGDVKLKIKPPATPYIDVNVGAGRLVIELDREVDYEVLYNIGVGSLSVDNSDGKESIGGFSSRGTYSSSDNDPKLIINVNVGAGAVEIIEK